MVVPAIGLASRGIPRFQPDCSHQQHHDNPLLKRPLEISDVKPLVVSHWGTTPGQNFIYAHLNRVINKYDLDMFATPISRPRDIARTKSRCSRGHMPSGLVRR
jgi:XFP-like protein